MQRGHQQFGGDPGADVCARRVTDLLARAQAGTGTITPAEKLRFHICLLTAFRHRDNLHYQFRCGKLERQMWESYDRTMPNGAWREWFRDNAACFGASLRTRVRERLGPQAP